MISPFVILHLSDLHFGPHGRFSKRDMRKLGQQFQQAVEQARAELGIEERVGLVIVTGDIAEAARPAEYEQATAFFEALLAGLQLPHCRVVFVPGNHDVSWFETKRIVQDQHEIGFSDAERDKRFTEKKFQTYEAFVKRFRGSGDGASVAGIGHGAYVHTFPELGVSVAALNSCELESHIRQGGYFSTMQAQALMEKWRGGEADRLIKIIAIHHNPVSTVPSAVKSWLAALRQRNGNLTEDVLAHFAADATGFEGWEGLRTVSQDCRVQLVLHGHHHASDTQAWNWHRGRKGQTQVLSSGSWGLVSDKLLDDQPAMMHLLRVDPVRDEARSVLRIYDPRARVEGVVEPGTFAADSANPTGATLQLFVPEGLKLDTQSLGKSMASVAQFDIATIQLSAASGKARRRAKGADASDIPSGQLSAKKSITVKESKARSRPSSGKTVQLQAAQMHRRFQEIIDPWLLHLWEEHGASIDALVEIAHQTRGNEDAERTGRRFAAHIGIATADSAGRLVLNVSTDALRRVSQSTEPGLIVAFDVKGDRVLYRWADDALFRELDTRLASWSLHEGVFVDFGVAQVFEAATLADIERTVMVCRRSGNGLMAPGAYFDYQQRAMRAADALTLLAEQHRIDSVKDRLERLRRRLQDATYMIALAGPSRAGKSTLLNALIRKELSPVSKLPTTAVSIVVTAGASDGATVYLQDGEPIAGSATVAFLGQYASQELNEDNKKGVQHIIVRLRNPALERGVAFVDAPGLRDPSPDIRVITERALKSSHAILYVLDVSTAADGGFSIDQPTIDEIRHLGGIADKMFLVLNKADRLGSEQRNVALKHVEDRLAKYNVRSHFAHAPIPVSARQGWEHELEQRDGLSPLDELEQILWKHLLETNSTGMDRLRVAVAELQRATEEFGVLLSDELTKTIIHQKLAESIARCEVRRDQLLAICARRRSDDILLLNQRLDHIKQVYLVRLEQDLNAIPQNQSLPSSEALSGQMRRNLLPDYLQLWGELGTRATAFSGRMGKDIEEALQQVRLVVKAPVDVQAPEPLLPAFGLDESDISPEVALGSFYGGIIGLAFGGVGVFAGLAIGAILGKIFGHEKNRRRQIEKRMVAVQQSLEYALPRAEAAMLARLEPFYRQMRDQINDRIHVFLHDVKQRIARGGIQLTEDEKAHTETAQRDVGKVSEEVRRLYSELERLSSRA